MTCGIYMIQNKVNGKIYIGQSVDIDKRWQRHKWELKSNRHDNTHLQRAWNKDGEDRFEFTIICECDESQLNAMEIDYIAKLRTYNPDFGYNLTYGGGGGRPTEETKKKMSEAQKGRIHSDETRDKISKALKGKYTGENNHLYGKHPSEETRKKISEARKGITFSEEHRKKISEAQKGENNNNFGKHFSEEHRKKISESNKGKVISEETKKKLSEANKGKTLSEEIRKKISESNKGRVVTEETRRKIGEANKGNIISEEQRKKLSEAHKGKHPSEETRRKMSEAQKGKTMSEEARKKLREANSIPVVQLTLEGKLVNVYGSAEEARRNGFNPSNIRNCLKGRRKTHGGYKWMYLHEYDSTVDISIIKTLNLFEKPCEVTPKKSKYQGIPVVQLTLEGELVNVYASAGEAGRNGFKSGNINKCIKGKLKKHGGYKWMRLEDYEAMKKEGLEK